MKRKWKKRMIFMVLTLILLQSVYSERIAYAESWHDTDKAAKDTTGYTVVEKSLDINKDYLEDTLITGLWQQGYYGKGVKIAVIDSGVDSNHEDLKVSQTLDCFSDFSKGCVQIKNAEDTHYHGTHVSGIINAQHNDLGTQGVAPLAELYVLQISIKEKNELLFDTKAYENAIDWAIDNGMQIINLSSGFDPDAAVTSKINEAVNKGISFVVSAGNYGRSEYSNANSTVSYPAILPKVIAVSNANSPSSLNNTSSIGPEIFIAAPGTGINSTVPKNKDNSTYFRIIEDDKKLVTKYWDNTNPEGYQQALGTSQAAPVVAGTLALLKEKYPNASSDDLKEYLRFMSKYASGDKLNERTDSATKQQRNDEFGYGYLQADMGKSVQKKIFLSENTKIYNLPNIKYPTAASISSQTVTVVREGEKGSSLEGWFEINTWLGYRWIKPVNFQEVVDLKLTVFENTTLYSDTNKTTSYGSITPQTVTATKRIGNWFEINTYLGPKWINTNNYTIGDFKLKLNDKETLYASKNGASTGAAVTPQTVTVLSRSNEWFQIKSFLGDSWIKPSSYEQQFKLTLNGFYNLYNSLNGSANGQKVGEISYTATRKFEDWFELQLGNYKQWIKPTSYFSGEYQLKLTQNSTDLYNTNDNSQSSVGKLTPQTVTVVERQVVEQQGGYWFLIKTPIGLKWCKPESGTYVEYQ